MKIAILNQPVANRGDEAAHKAFVRRLSTALPECQIDVIILGELQEVVDAIKVNEPNVNYLVLPINLNLARRIIQVSFALHIFAFSYIHPQLLKFKKQLKTYDKIICAPGGICMGGFLNWNHIWQLKVAKQLKKPIYYWGRSIGPFYDSPYRRKVFKKYSYELLHYFKYTSLRDSVSVDLANKIGINVHEVVDSAFLECPDVQLPQELNFFVNDFDYVVFVPNELTWHYRYKNIAQNKIDDFFIKIIKFVEHKYPSAKIVMLPQTYKSKINDYAYFRKLSGVLNDERIIVLDENQSSDVQQKIVSGSKLVIGTRYHSVVFAINNNIPFIALSYEHKISGLLEKLKLTKSLINIQNIFDDGNEKIYNECLANIEDLITNKLERPDSKNAQEIVNKEFSSFIKCLSRE